MEQESANYSSWPNPFFFCMAYTLKMLFTFSVIGKKSKEHYFMNMNII